MDSGGLVRCVKYDKANKEKVRRKQTQSGTLLVLQWLRLIAPNAGGLGSILGQGTRSHTLQLRPGADK